jgi:hypothetical protein
MRVYSILVLIAVAGCASSGSSPESSPRQETVRIMGAGGPASLPVTSNSGSQVTKIMADADKVWLALPGAYEKLAIPITEVDTLHRRVANSGLKIRRQMGGTSLSRYIECGSTQIGDNADSYDVYLTVSTSVKSDGAGAATIETLFESQAKPVSFSREYARCSTKGLLETRIAEAVKAQLH